jgi:hypothetical protein
MIFTINVWLSSLASLLQITPANMTKYLNIVIFALGYTVEQKQVKSENSPMNDAIFYCSLPACDVSLGKMSEKKYVFIEIELLPTPPIYSSAIQKSEDIPSCHLLVCPRRRL